MKKFVAAVFVVIAIMACVTAALYVIPLVLAALAVTVPCLWIRKKLVPADPSPSCRFSVLVERGDDRVVDISFTTKGVEGQTS